MASDEMTSKALELCRAVENEEEFPPAKFALRCLMLINQIRKLAEAAPQPDTAPSGFEQAALHIEKKAASYLNDHCWTEPDTGATVCPGDGLEYYNDLLDCAAEIRQQAPQSQPDTVAVEREVLEEWERRLIKMMWREEAAASIASELRALLDQEKTDEQ